jgi:polysaccharide deacetylase family protein (PEP-CTERM system associated)
MSVGLWVRGRSVKRFAIATFDVEEHFRIEAAVGLEIDQTARDEYGRRMECSTRRLLDQLAGAEARATFFIVGEIARDHPELIRAIHDGGHEVASHSWDHRRVHRFDRHSFRDDLLKGKDALEQACGSPVVGFRAPTFSISRDTPWAIDVLADCGFEYDSSIFPVRHDRYGIPDAPRRPFLAVGDQQEILELPLATYRIAGFNLPVAGGGYFRLFPLAMMKAGLRQADSEGSPGMLYFHPWEFDPDQPRLPLRGLNRWRTYVGMGKTTSRLNALLETYSMGRAIDLARHVRSSGAELTRFKLGGS